MTRPDELRIRDINECIEAIANSKVLLDGMPPNPALAITVIDAVTHRLMIIGDAVKGLSPEFLTQHPDVPWRDMMRLRDLIGTTTTNWIPRLSGQHLTSHWSN